jgi:hypothetical protein
MGLGQQKKVKIIKLIVPNASYYSTIIGVGAYITNLHNKLWSS